MSPRKPKKFDSHEQDEQQILRVRDLRAWGEIGGLFKGMRREPNKKSILNSTVQSLLSSLVKKGEIDEFERKRMNGKPRCFLRQPRITAEGVLQNMTRNIFSLGSDMTEYLRNASYVLPNICSLFSHHAVLKDLS